MSDPTIGRQFKVGSGAFPYRRLTGAINQTIGDFQPGPSKEKE